MDNKFKQQVATKLDKKAEELSLKVFGKTNHGFFIERPNDEYDNLLVNSVGLPIPFAIIRGKRWGEIHSIRISIPSIMHISSLYMVPVFDYMETIEHIILHQTRLIEENYMAKLLKDKSGGSIYDKFDN